MKITRIEVSNFKRFSALTLRDIPETAKLVLLIGANGSGKSSVFDIFGFIKNRISLEQQKVFDDYDYLNYFKKETARNLYINIFFDGDKKEMIIDNSRIDDLSANNFYGRTSFRQIPRLTRTALGQGAAIDFEKDSDRPLFFIDRDTRFENDIEKITETILKEFFLSTQSTQQIKQKFIEPLNTALNNIFGKENGTKLELLEIIPPLEGKTAQITFRKGISTFHYNYLSAGEKEVFNLLVNLLSRSALYQDTIYYLDEMDLHLNTKIQYNLLKEITENWIPQNSQLWTATHSLGFIEYAKQAENTAIMDFSDLDFDLPQVITPEPKDNPDIYEIAVGKDFLPALFQHLDVYFVENNDRDYYATIGIPNAVFIKEHNRNSVYHKARTMPIYGIVDRDYLSDSDINEIKKEYVNLYVLDFYSIENYIYHPDNLAAYHQQKGDSFDKKQYIEDLTEAKNEIKNKLILEIALTRTGYPYFGEPQFNNTPLQNRFKNKKENYEQVAMIQAYLESDDFALFYKALPMKTYCKHLPQRQNISKTELVKTAWFKETITQLLSKK